MKKRTILMGLGAVCTGAVILLCVLAAKPTVLQADLSALNGETALEMANQINLAGTYEELSALEQEEAGLNWNMPNSGWWVRQWLAEEDAKAVACQKRGGKDTSPAVFFVNEERKSMEAVLWGVSGNVKLLMNSLQSTGLGTLSKVKVTIESVRLNGVLAACPAPVLEQEYTVGTEEEIFSVLLKDAVTYKIYHVIVEPAGIETLSIYQNEQFSQRFEAGKLHLSGGAKEIDGVVKGLEEEQSGVALKWKAPQTGSYYLNVVYSNAYTDAQGEPVTASQEVLVDGETVAKLNYPATGAEDRYGSTGVFLDLEAGSHTIILRTGALGGPVLSCLELTFRAGMQEEEATPLYQGLKDTGNTNHSKSAFLLVVPADGYYTLEFVTKVALAETVNYKIDGTDIDVLTMDTGGGAEHVAYLRRGLNRLEVGHAPSNQIKAVSATAVSRQLEIPEGATTGLELGNAVCGGGVQLFSSAGGTVAAGNFLSMEDQAQIDVLVKETGRYRLTFSYACYNASKQTGALRLLVNGVEQQINLPTTYSPDMYRTITVFVALEAGKNTIVFSGIQGADAASQILRISVPVLNQSFLPNEKER